MNDFDDIPSLSDTQGLETYLNNENLANAGLGASNTPAPASTETQPVDQAVDNNTPNPQVVTTAQMQQILESVNALNKRLDAIERPAQPAPQPRPTAQQPQQDSGYSEKEKQFIIEALNRGYSMSQIQDILNRNAPQTALAKKVDALEQAMRNREYLEAQNAFISKMTEFGNKWGLSEQDLVTFGNQALSQGINIAQVQDLEMVFRAIYPEQYRIRAARLQPTPTSQIYGGATIPESNRATASRMEDAYVEQFLSRAMPNYQPNSPKK